MLGATCGDNTSGIGNVNTYCIATHRIATDMELREVQSSRLREARGKKYATMKAAIDAFGFVEPTYRSHENGGRGFDSEHAVRYGKAFGVDPVWLLGFEQRPSHSALPTFIDKAPDQPSSRDASAGEIVQIMRLDLSLPMGPGATVDEYVEEEPLDFDLAYIRSFTRTPTDRLRLARGIGESMYPTLNNNDLVWIDSTQRQLNQSDRVWAVSINGAAAIKRLRPLKGGRVLVISDNPAIGDYEVGADELLIGGRIIRFARDL